MVLGPPSKVVPENPSSVPFPTVQEIMSDAEELRAYISCNLFPVGTCRENFLVQVQGEALKQRVTSAISTQQQTACSCTSNAAK